MKASELANPTPEVSTWGSGRSIKDGAASTVESNRSTIAGPNSPIYEGFSASDFQSQSESPVSLHSARKSHPGSSGVLEGGLDCRRSILKADGGSIRRRTPVPLPRHLSSIGS